MSETQFDVSKHVALVSGLKEGLFFFFTHFSEVGRGSICFFTPTLHMLPSGSKCCQVGTSFSRRPSWVCGDEGLTHRIN